MPRRDGTGPDNMGARTGRGLGDCQPGENDNTTAGSSFFGRRFLGRGAFGNGSFGGGGYGARSFFGGRGRNRFFPNSRRFVEPVEAANEGDIQAEITFLEQRMDQLKTLLKK